MTEEYLSRVIERLKNEDLGQRRIFLMGLKCTDEQVEELFDCLLLYNNAIEELVLRTNEFTDVTGLKLAQFVAKSTTLTYFSAPRNKLGVATHLAIADALRVNTSLRSFDIQCNLAVDKVRVDSAFVDALRVNPDRPAPSTWRMYGFSWYCGDYSRLKVIADELGAPSMLSLLSAAEDVNGRNSYKLSRFF